MKPVRWLVVLLLALVVFSAACLDNNFVYARGKSVPPGETRGWPFKGPANLTVEISSSVPVEVKVVSSDGTVLRDFGTVREVNDVVELPKGVWKVVISNPGNETAVIDVKLKT
ncbi:hypothetical protein CL1_1032 [Thermococcus cleftensis]|uniref:Uncharacterized protein n=1 Tax=Thermococcus cleftensis (strain DSM 27260 / KACC 17922 / CL1) TaxID=163003 RepID=I3ZU51_THECF|nr:hypothetical protein [Thermococcus cleftensis]AFL95235.1 hypothetical protein CL1_1032 [Thermococcus cleftensis]